MYIVAIGWAYVILMMAITSSSIGKGLAVLFFLGVLPLGLFVYVAGWPRRRSMVVPDKITDQRDGPDAKPDQH
ncbi:MAG: hypothetical protein R6W97_11105 [Thiobacillus sp.]